MADHRLHSLYAQRWLPLLGDSRHETITATGRVTAASSSAVCFTDVRGVDRTFRRSQWDVRTSPVLGDPAPGYRPLHAAEPEREEP